MLFFLIVRMRNYFSHKKILYLKNARMELRSDLIQFLANNLFLR